MLTPKDSTLTLPTVRLTLGILAIVLSLIFSIQFVSQGATGAAIIGAISFCLITEFCKVMFTGDCAYYWQTEQGSKALFSAVLVAVLFALSISAAVFVLTISPAKQEAIVSQSDSKQKTLEAAIAAKQQQLAACNQSYLSKCVNPRTAELGELQQQLNAVLATGKDTLEARAAMQFWNKAAEYLGTDANSLQLNFAIARAVLLDVLGLILVSQYTASKRIQANFKHIPPQDIVQPLVPDTQALLAEIEALKLELHKAKDTEKKQ